MTKAYFFLALLIFPAVLFAQEDDMIRVMGDSLVGKFIDGQSIREVHGNVIMKQGKITITCKKAVQYLAKNEAELIGNVVVTQDSIVISTELGYYYGNSKIAFSQSGVEYFDGHVHLKSKNGYYYFIDKKAYFYEKVNLFDSISSLTSNKLTYYDDEDRAVAVGDVVVKDTSSVVEADSLIHFRDDGNSFAFNNVKIFDPKNKLVVSGNYLESQKKKNYSKILGEPTLIKIDTTKSGKLDTLVIKSKIMEAYSDSSERMIATDSVRIVRGEFASINNYTIYYRDNQNLFTLKRENDDTAPIIWNEGTQLTGDTINIFLQDNRLKEMIINSNALIITEKPEFPLRFDQMSGSNMNMYFGENSLEQTLVKGNVLSIYYLYEDGEPNGLLKSSSEEAKIYFKDNSVENVRLYGNPVSDFHPENLIEGKEKDFTLPTFIVFGGRPKKFELLSGKENFIKSLLEYSSTYGK